MTEQSETSGLDKLNYQQATTMRLSQSAVRTDFQDSEQRTVTVRHLTDKVVIRYAPREDRQEPTDTSAT